MEETIRFLGVVCFAYGVLWHSAILKEARGRLAPDHLAPLHRIHRLTITRDFGPLLPLVGGLALLGTMPSHASAILVLAATLTVVLLALRGWSRARSLHGAGLPATYVRSYRKAYAIQMGSLAACAAAFVYPALQQAAAV